MSEKKESVDQEKEQKQHWLHYSFSKRQKKSLLLIAVFIILGIFSSLMYLKTDGDYSDVTDGLVETIQKR